MAAVDAVRGLVQNAAQMDRIAPPMQDGLDQDVVLDVSSWGLEGQLEAGQKVAELIEHPGWNVLWEGIGIYVSEGFKTKMVESPREQADYAKWLGECDGLSKVTAIAHAIEKAGADAAAEIREND